ncbi:aspartate dehydrogenase [Bacillus piscicola]|uniref:aspartate dehydrogenase n=1 Tax=Bacillus piscicola TaxID=1632684 RepID=UPI001F09F33F|nr:aspartate dehydrogenase [Bacillus piscicola]
MHIGIIGTGNIASFLLEAINGNPELKEEMQICSLYGRNEKVGAELAAAYHIDFYTDIDEFLDSSIEVVAEAATVQAVKAVAPHVLKAGKDLLLSSVGALSDPAFYSEARTLAGENAAKLYIPSGAIGGLDMIQSAQALGGLQKVAITTRKTPQSLGITEDSGKETIVFQGSAAEAIEKFPKNINVAIILSLAGIGTTATTVTISADPQVTKNTHTIEAAGTFGNFQTTIENEPMPNNPKTSYLAALSILSTLQNKNQSIQIGG